MASETDETKSTFTLTSLSCQLQNYSISTPIKFSPLNPSVGITLIDAIRVFLDTSGESIRWWLIDACYSNVVLIHIRVSRRSRDLYT